MISKDKDFSGIVAAVHIAYAMGTIESSFVLLHEYVHENKVSESSLREMLGKHYSAYIDFFSNKEKVSVLGQLVAIQNETIRRNRDASFQSFLSDFMGRTTVPAEVLEKYLTDDFMRRSWRTLREVENRRSMRRLGWAHPSNEIGALFCRLNLALTRAIVNEMKRKERWRLLMFWAK